jgi:hypothetical protein
MFKKLLVSLFLLFSSLTVLATSVDFNKVDAHTKESALTLTLNQINSKLEFASTKALTPNEVVVNLDDTKIQNKIKKSEQEGNEQTSWLLIFALLGFVLLSNRRGV